MYIDATDDGGNSIVAFMTTISNSSSTIQGHVRISEKSNTNDFILFQITNVAGQDTNLKRGKIREVLQVMIQKN